MFPSPSPPPPSQPKKVVTQRLYREKEGTHFNTLRDVIKRITGEELQRRQDILLKAIELLSVTSDTGMQMDAQVVPSASGSHNVLPANSPANFTLDYADYSAQCEAHDCPQHWHPENSYTGAARLPYGQLDHFNADSRLDSGSYQGHDKDSPCQWSYHPQT